MEVDSEEPAAASWLEKAEAYKAKGNALFGEKKYKKAIAQFARVRAYTWQPNGEAAQYAGSKAATAHLSVDDKKALARLDAIACGNMAQCHLNLGDARQCLSLCGTVIGTDLDSAHPNPDLLVKALSRSAQACLRLNDLDRGQAFVKRALAIDEKNTVARLTYKKLREAYKVHNAEQKKAMAAAFANA